MTETNMDKKHPIEKIESEEFTLRPLNIKKDFEELIPFYDQIFEKELSAKGASVRAMLSEMKTLMPILRFMGIFQRTIDMPLMVLHMKITMEKLSQQLI